MTAPIIVQLADGDDANDISAKFIAAVNLAGGLYTASTPNFGEPYTFLGVPLSGAVELESVQDADLPDITAANFTFIDDDSEGTPSVGVTVTNQGSTSSVTLNNFISGSTLTLNAALGTHFVNMKTDTTADVLNLVLANLGDHGYVEGDDVETLNIDTAGNTPSLDKVDFGGGDLTTIVVTGSNGLQLDTSSTIVSSVDASALGGAFIWDAGFNEVNIVVRTGAGGSDVDFTQMTIPGGNASAGTHRSPSSVVRVMTSSRPVTSALRVVPSPPAAVSMTSSSGSLTAGTTSGRSRTSALRMMISISLLRRPSSVVIRNSSPLPSSRITWIRRPVVTPLTATSLQAASVTSGTTKTAMVTSMRPTWCRTTPTAKTSLTAATL